MLSGSHLLLPYIQIMDAILPVLYSPHPAVMLNGALLSRCNGNASSNINDSLRMAQCEGSAVELMKRPGGLVSSSPSAASVLCMWDLSCCKVLDHH